MTILDTLITDRTREDAARVRALTTRGWDNLTPAEKSDWENGLKGAYGPSDMNRVRESLEYIDRLMVNAKRGSVFQPAPIGHAEYNGTAWIRWTDVVTVDSDYVGPDIYLPNINRFWAAARRFTAIVPPLYDPNGTGYIKPDAPLDAGMLFKVTDSFGLLELRVTAVCPSDVTAEGVAWTVAKTPDGWTAVLDYPVGPYPDIGNALGALKIFNAADVVVDGMFTLSATLRYDYEVTAGTCAVRWSPFIIWREARDKYGTWGGAKPLAWGEAGRGEEL